MGIICKNCYAHDSKGRIYNDREKLQFLIFANGKLSRIDATPEEAQNLIDSIGLELVSPYYLCQKAGILIAKESQ